MEKGSPNKQPFRLLTEAPLVGAIIGVCEAALVLRFDPEVTLDALGAAAFITGAGLAAALSTFLFVLVFIGFSVVIGKISQILHQLIIGKRPNALGLAIFGGFSFYGLFYLNEYLLPGKLHPLSLAVDLLIIAIAYVIYRVLQLVDIGRKRTVIPGLSVLIIAITVALWAGGVFLPNRADSGDITLFDEPAGVLTGADKNLIIITVDTARVDRFGCYDPKNELSPNLDRLAEGGVLFVCAYGAQPLTGPSHTAMFSGMRPREAGIVQNGIPVPDEIDMAAEVLACNGYRTGAIIGVFVVSSAMNFDQGFGHFDDYFNPFAAFSRLAWAKIGGMLGILNTKGRIQRRAGAVTDRAIKWLESDSRERPFFLWLHYFDPHTPYDPPGEWADVSDADDPNIRAYDGEVAYMDSEIGILIDYLEDNGLTDNTVIIVVADHGESLGEHDYYWDHGKYLYDTETRVPLIINGPGVPSGSVMEGVFETRQIPELVYPLLGDTDWETAYAPFAGKRDAFGEALEEGEYRTMWVREESVGSGTGLYKRVNNPDGTSALYDLSDDPNETNDDALSHPELHKELGDSIERIEKEQPPLPERLRFDEATEDKLHDLGYL
ncbi:MAG: sulfatase-like hydrolase/transferase [bacterium]|nr:sulfatase-like hydrolase/transferase [bacterium]